LQASLIEEARGVSETEAVALSQFFNVAVVEKLSALRTEEFFQERGTRGDVGKAKRLLKRAGRGTLRRPLTNWTESQRRAGRLACIFPTR
jgi:hypothetical protein